MKKPTMITLTAIAAILVAAIQQAHNESLEFPFVSTAEEIGRKNFVGIQTIQREHNERIISRLPSLEGHQMK